MKYHLVFLTLLCILLSACHSERAPFETLIPRIAEKGKYNGFLHLEQNGRVLYHHSVQTAREGLPGISDSSKLYIASLTKLFTEIAILKLQEQGKISLDEKISRYRASFQPEFGQKVTIRDLLKMQSGLPRELSMDSNIMQVVYNEEGRAGPSLDTMPDFELSFAPGTNTEYSNLNYWILGTIIEALTGRGLQEAFEQLIFEELQMKGSGLFWKRETSALIPGYIFAGGEWQEDSTHYEGRYASGGCHSTVNDLVRLSKALSGEEFLTEESKKILAHSTKRIEAYGALPAFSNIFIQDLEKGYTLIFLNNVGLPDLSSISVLKERIENHLGIEIAPIRKRTVTLKPIHSLNDSVRLESAFKQWIKAVESESAEAIFQTITNASVKDAMDPTDPTWTELSRLNTQLPNFRALGFRHVIDEQPAGLEVWFGSDVEGKLAIRWLASSKDSTLVANLFVMPDDMTWLGKSY